ncbi:MAG: GNAT family N-acetyltransferase, partial [Gammaproteobacteria bacterium]|nr:GNAT family N-acetyltransferase [Gammaproteobacteria bacterium]
MKIRKATRSDALNISAIGACVWVDTYATEGVSDEISKYVATEFTAEKASLLIKNKTVLVSENENSILGYMVLGSEKNNKTEIE